MKAKTQLLIVLLIFAITVIYSCKKEGQSSVDSETMWKNIRKMRDSAEVSRMIGYLEKINKLDEYGILKNLFVREGFYESEAERFGFLLTILNVSPDLIEYLKKNGYDVILWFKKGRLIDIKNSPIEFWEKAMCAELVIIGNVLRTDYYPGYKEPGDGYHQSVVISVEEVLVGNVSSDTIILRQISCEEGKGVIVTNEIRYKPGDRYLFFLSNAYYRYNSDPQFGFFEIIKPMLEYPEEFRKICYIETLGVPHPIIDGKLEYPPSVNMTRLNISDTDKILSEIRKIGKLRKEFEEKMKGR